MTVAEALPHFRPHEAAEALKAVHTAASAAAAEHHAVTFGPGTHPVTEKTTVRYPTTPHTAKVGAIKPGSSQAAAVVAAAAAAATALDHYGSEASGPIRQQLPAHLHLGPEKNARLHWGHQLSEQSLNTVVFAERADAEATLHPVLGVLAHAEAIAAAAAAADKPLPATAPSRASPLPGYQTYTFVYH